MELKISRKEIEAVLLEWAQAQFPNKFNDVYIRASYGSLDYAEFSLIDPKVVAITEGAGEAA